MAHTALCTASPPSQRLWDHAAPAPEGTARPPLPTGLGSSGTPPAAPTRGVHWEQETPRLLYLGHLRKDLEPSRGPGVRSPGRGGPPRLKERSWQHVKRRASPAGAQDPARGPQTQGRRAGSRQVLVRPLPPSGTLHTPLRVRETRNPISMNVSPSSGLA